MLLIITCICLITIIYSNFDSSTIMFGLNYQVLSTILLGLFIPVIFYQVKGKYTTEDAFKLVGFILLIGMGLSYFILIREYSIKYFIFMMLIPILTDTFAFAGGMMIGKHKVTKISPNKSWEGYTVGTVMGTFIMTVYYTTFINVQTNLIMIIGIILMLSIIGQLGDLFFSAIKDNMILKIFLD